MKYAYLNNDNKVQKSPSLNAVYAATVLDLATFNMSTCLLRELCMEL